MRTSCRPQRGVSLVEALVALGVMAFGMLGLVGMQATMRMNSDIAKQRSEAVRLTQTNIEARRSYDTMAAYGAVAAAAGVASGANATYEWEILVPPAVASPPLKTIVATATWQDRAGNDQMVQLQTSLAGTPPELGAAISVPGSGTSRKPRGRAPGIPPEAVNQGDGTSRFVPPAIGSNPPVAWVFDNVSGYIIKLCDETFTTCTSTNLLPLTGYMRFASAPTPSEAEMPTGTAVAVGVKVETSSPSTATVVCAVSPPTTGPGGFVAYYCALPLTTTEPFTWSGQSLVYDAAGKVATESTDVDPTHFRVCRYTPTAASGPQAHPSVYTDVAVPLSSQNFLLIPAGDNTNVYQCPTDSVSTTPYVDGMTADHQPL